MNLAAAIDLDRAGDVEAAALAYEQVLRDEVSLTPLMNLALLYWQVCDPGAATPAALRELAMNRFPQLIDEAERRFPLSTTPRFWKKYIAWADLGEPFDVEECRQLLRQDPSNPLPALYVFAATHGSEAAEQAATLLDEARTRGTAGDRYVASVLQSNALPPR